LLTFPRKGLIFGGNVEIWPKRAWPGRSKPAWTSDCYFSGLKIYFSRECLAFFRE